jgi:hypothetical protein
MERLLAKILQFPIWQQTGQNKIINQPVVLMNQTLIFNSNLKELNNKQEENNCKKNSKTIIVWLNSALDNIRSFCKGNDNKKAEAKVNFRNDNIKF